MSTIGRSRSALLVLSVLCLAASSAQAQRNVQRTPEGRYALANKDVGDERWAIARDLETGIVTGNVYRADGGDPQFLWCWPIDAGADPLRLRCQGTRGCDAWVDLGDVELAASFFEAAACEAGDAASAPAGRRSDRIHAATLPSSALRRSPDMRTSLIAKDVGGLRWTMIYDYEDTSITGNVFDPAGGPPQFVSCRREPNADKLTCRGASGCGCGACGAADWTPLGEIDLPPGFSQSRRCPATPAPRGLVASLTPSRREDALTGGFGSRVAVAGGIAVVGAPETAAYVFENGPDGWHETARIAPFEPSPARPGSGRFAAEVAISGTTAVVMDDGRVRILEPVGGSWSLTSTVIPPEAEARVARVAIDGPRMVLTVNFSDLQEPNRAHVYERSGSSWKRTATILPPGHAPFERLGDLSLAGDRIVLQVVGGKTPYPPASTEASLELYEHRSGAWAPTSSVPLPFSPLHDQIASLAFDGGDLIVGTAPSSPRHRSRGTVRWLAPGRENGNEIARFSACSPDVGRFGRIVAVSGETLVVGAPDYPGGGAAGEVHVFSRRDGTWAPEGRLRVGDTAPDSLALDGRTLAVGSVSGPTGGGGAVQIFDLDQVELLPPVPCPEDPPEVWPAGEWRVESPVEHGMNPVLLARAGAYALQPDGNTQGVVVARHGVIVAEWYEQGRDAASYAGSWSVAKSVAGALIGVAIARGDIRDENVGMAEFYPQWRGTEKADITLRNVLQMTSGVDFGENHSTRPDNVSDIAYLASMAKDHLAYVLELPLTRPPGTLFSYSSGDSMMLSGVIEAATGLTAGEYARRYLFDPLGMSRAQWWSDAVGHTLTYCCFDAPSREFARIGLLYAREGRWNGNQILPERWVRDSAESTYTEVDGPHGYGYQWYTVDSSAGTRQLEAFGFDGQHIYVIPELDLVVVRNGHYDKDPGPPIADPNLFARYPAAGLVPGKGTKPPGNGWSMGRVLGPIVDAVVTR